MIKLFDIQQYKQHVQEAVQQVRQHTSLEPRIGVICGTGMGGLATQIAEAVSIPYRRIPHFPLSTVESHDGNLVLGHLSGTPVMMMQGRFHRYEGYTLKQVTFPVRVMQQMGCTHLVVMNAVGSMNPLIRRGSIVLVTDHVNFMGENPLVGPNDEQLGPRFPDMSEPYDHGLQELAREVATEAKIRLNEGVLVAVTGPNLETRAEYRMFRQLGMDIVTMSTVPEVIVARHAGMKVMALSTVTDECLPDALKPADIREIIEAAQSAEPRLVTLVTGVLSRLSSGRPARDLW